MLVLAHYDTVHPVGTTERNRVRIESDKLFGPGTYDMKAGAYLALQAMSALYRERQPARPVELLLVPDEESGGGSDGNFTAAFGVPTLDGLGAEGDGAHTLHEHIVVSTLPLRLQFLHGLLRDLAWDTTAA